jgi:ABC-type lipoprotein release transport system permease subunit
MMGSRLYPSVQPSTVLLSGLAVTVIAALASLYPAWQASRKEPAAALHHI